MECPICKNKMGFGNGRCVECGYNYLTHEFEEIKINTKILQEYLPEHVYFALLEEYEKRKRC